MKDMNEKKKCVALVLAAGVGRRMGSAIKKQYMELGGKPVLYLSLKTFQDSGIIDEIVLVAGESDLDFVSREIVDKYGFEKVTRIVPGGTERYDSVWQGLLAIPDEEGYVFIHDGARPFVSEEIIRRGYDDVSQYRACAAGMPSRDTVKLADREDFVLSTPDRDSIWLMQTPQVFEIPLIKEAYGKFMEQEEKEATDDAMVVEQMLQVPVKLFEGSYENMKITLPADLKLAEAILRDIRRTQQD